MIVMLSTRSIHYVITTSHVVLHIRICYVDESGTTACIRSKLSNRAPTGSGSGLLGIRPSPVLPQISDAQQAASAVQCNSSAPVEAEGVNAHRRTTGTPVPLSESYATYTLCIEPPVPLGFAAHSATHPLILCLGRSRVAMRGQGTINRTDQEAVLARLSRKLALIFGRWGRVQ
ncbi:hypothetical protein FKP32DRAFT_1348510 [Trametes sanguinea]|nr:hypothetical protein FKP32DRAFT_1348510 [Trametes sanguinea]